MKLVVQQVTTGLFLKRYLVWVRSKEEGRVFADVAAAINCCISLGVRDVRVAKYTDEWELEGYLELFGAQGLDLSSNAMVAELRRSIEENRALREKQRDLKAQLDSVAAEGKETKKKIPFKRKKVGESE